MYDKCYFCLDQLPKLKKESTASFFVNFGRSRGTKEPTYITVSQSMEPNNVNYGKHCWSPVVSTDWVWHARAKTTQCKLHKK